MVRIRLSRVGAKNQPSYRVVVADQRSPRDGRFLEIIGHYNPRTDPSTVMIREDRALHWLMKGASPSDAVARMLRNTGIAAKYDALKAGEQVEITTDLASTGQGEGAVAETAAPAAAVETPAAEEVADVAAASEGQDGTVTD